jgi:hypothetical protein
VVHQQTHRAAFVKVRRRLLEKRVDGGFEIELLDLESSERLGQGGFGQVGLSQKLSKSHDLQRYGKR